MIAIILMSIVLLLYTSVYLGYQNKLLQNIDQFPAEYKAATVILDEYTDNDNLLFGFLDRAYDARKFTHATIYSLSERSESDLKAIIKKFPSNRLDFDLNKNRRSFGRCFLGSDRCVRCAPK